MTIIKLYTSLNTSHFIGFLEKVKQGKAQAAGSGFGGKGLDRLDRERDAKEIRSHRRLFAGDIFLEPCLELSEDLFVTSYSGAFNDDGAQLCDIRTLFDIVI